MQKLCCVRTRQHPLPVWSHKFVISSLTHFSTNSRPFLVGIVSRFQGRLQYGSIPLLTYWGMTILLNLEWPSDTGYTSRGYIPHWICSVGIQKNLKLFQPNKSTPTMTKGHIFTSGPTKFNKYVGSLPI